MRRTFVCAAGLCLLALLLCTATKSTANVSASPLAVENQLAFDPSVQSPELFYNEALTVYYGNLARRNNSVPPLRWNRELTLSARWFAWDSVENRANGYCGHQDTWELWPSDRNARYGYLGWNGAENAYCGYMQPQDAINGWMNSPGHRTNLLDTNSREIGMGYYRRSSDGRGYLVQDFGTDSVMPPVIIENEAPNTTSQQVGLYIYSNKEASGWTGLAPAKYMRISNGSCINEASWVPYQAEKPWTLPTGEGWKTVNVQTRDAEGRTSKTFDSIYLGASIPTSQLNLSQLTQTSSQVTLYNLDSGGMPYIELSQGWIADDSDPNFSPGDGTKLTSDTDAAAVGGTAFRLSPGGHTWMWDWTYNEFPNNMDYVAYFRLKTDNNTSGSSLVNVSVDPGAAPGVSLSIKGTDFKIAGQYQEFAVPFHYATSSDDMFMIFSFSLSGNANVWVDGVTIFTTYYPLNGSSFTWNVPGGHYRGQGIWVRYVNGQGSFTNYQEAATEPGLTASPDQLTWLALPNRSTSHFQVKISICGVGTWSVQNAPPWLKYTISRDTLDVYADTTGMAENTYQNSLVIAGKNTTTTISLRLIVTDRIETVALPIVQR